MNAEQTLEIIEAHVAALPYREQQAAAWRSLLADALQFMPEASLDEFRGRLVARGVHPAVDVTPKGMEMPEGLSEKGKTAYGIILAMARKHDLTGTGGCTAFYHPAVWKARGELYGTTSELVVVYDGGDLKYLCSLDGEMYDLNEELRVELEKAGLFIEEGTSWQCAVHLL